MYKYSIEVCQLFVVVAFFFFFGWWGGWGHAPLVIFCILEVATQIVLETVFEMPSVLNRE